MLFSFGMKALPKILLALTGVAALSLAYPASVQAVPTTYKYTGNHFTFVTGPYTTSDFVTAMVTLARPLRANMPLTEVTPIAFTLSDGVQTLRSSAADTFGSFFFATDAFGHIAAWQVDAILVPDTGEHGIHSSNLPFNFPPSEDDGSITRGDFGANEFSPGTWTVSGQVPDVGSTLSLMTLTLMALGLVARRFQRAAG
jgi:hypothetical protein